MANRYSAIELATLRAAIAGCRHLDERASQLAAAAVSNGECPPHLAAFWGRSELDPDLFRKLADDPLLSTYSMYALFPGIYERLYHDGRQPRLAWDGRTRGPVALFGFDDAPGLVVKPLQSRREAEIAGLAGRAGIGPSQFPTVDGFLVEELLPGPFLTELPAAALTGEVLYAIGRRLGTMLSTLHSHNIYYNDATLSDPEGRSHLVVNNIEGSSAGNGGAGSGGESPGPDCRLLDFGVSALLDNFPHLEMEEVFNVARTTPEYRLLSRMGLRGAELGQFLVQYRQRLAAGSREEILSRDLRFTREGIRQVATRFGPDIIPPLQEGFAQGYG